MAGAIAIQETTIFPAGDGYRVRLFVSDKPPADEAPADLALTLRVRIAGTPTERLARLQLAALNAAMEALRPLMSELYD